MNFFYEVLILIRNCFLLVCGLLIISNATLELLFSPMLLIKYYLPSILRHLQPQQQQSVITTNNQLSLPQYSTTLILFFYIILILIQILNIIASLLLFYQIFITNYHDKYIAYDTIMLLSLTLSLSLIIQQQQIDWNFYDDIVQRDFYIQINRVGDHICQTTTTITTTTSSKTTKNSTPDDIRSLKFPKKSVEKPKQYCYHSDVYYWHQMNRCCGWQSPYDLIGIVKFNNTNGRGRGNVNDDFDDNHGNDDQNNRYRLPEFCCETLINNQYHGIIKNMWLKNLYKQQQQQQPNYCFIGSIFMFNRTCKVLYYGNAFNTNRQQQQSLSSTSRTSILSLRNLSLINHPIELIYILLKLIITFIYAYYKQHLLPQIEGPYSFYLSP
ncbi:uncharacterized protein LOC113795834 [Dermatophagoides pteronyssinus]|uniref:uncharacterized protein LOC113795834 n=1 Tax=Dermatophagoides pteronyssinus TaxID=6956 RepID=UPI003F66AC61